MGTGPLLCESPVALKIELPLEGCSISKKRMILPQTKGRKGLAACEV